MTAPVDQLTEPQKTQIAAIVDRYIERKNAIELFGSVLRNDIEGFALLRPLVHSTRSRLKDAESLRDKLARKYLRALGEHTTFTITPDNLPTTINDLVGFRILHLYAAQVGPIDVALREMLRELSYELVEGPVANVWDSESRTLLEKMGITCVENPRMYTSVHYVVGSRRSGGVTAEIQVRTLAEELWGEVDHRINYPAPTESLACREQIRVLARIASGCTRLADSIFRSHEEHASSRASGRD